MQWERHVEWVIVMAKQSWIFSELSCAGGRGERQGKVVMKREKMMINKREKTMRKLYSCGLWWMDAAYNDWGRDHENDTIM